MANDEGLTTIEVNRKRLKIALKKTFGHISETAEMLGITRQTVSAWLDKYKLRGYMEDLRQLNRDIRKGRVKVSLADD